MLTFPAQSEFITQGRRLPAARLRVIFGKMTSEPSVRRSYPLPELALLGLLWPSFGTIIVSDLHRIGAGVLFTSGLMVITSSPSFLCTFSGFTAVSRLLQRGGPEPLKWARKRNSIGQGVSKRAPSHD